MNISFSKAAVLLACSASSRLCNTPKDLETGLGDMKQWEVRWKVAGVPPPPCSAPAPAGELPARRKPREPEDAGI